MEHVVQFDTKRRTLPGLDIPLRAPRKRGILRGSGTGGAWLSSARVVRRPLKCGNERNPCLLLHISGDCLVSNREEGEEDVKSACPLRPGLHTSYNGKDNGSRWGNLEQILQTFPQFRLQAATRLHEAGIGSNRGSADRGEYVLAPCTHCPSSQRSWQRPKCPLGPKARSATRTKS